MKITSIERKRFRVRNKAKRVSSKERYRLSVNRSTKNISAQIIDDIKNTWNALDLSSKLLTLLFGLTILYVIIRWI